MAKYFKRVISRLPKNPNLILYVVRKSKKARLIDWSQKLFWEKGDPRKTLHHRSRFCFSNAKCFKFGKNWSYTLWHYSQSNIRLLPPCHLCLSLNNALADTLVAYLLFLVKFNNKLLFDSGSMNPFILLTVVQRAILKVKVGHSDRLTKTSLVAHRQF